MSRQLKIVQSDAGIVAPPEIDEPQGPRGSTTSVGLDFTPRPDPQPPCRLELPPAASPQDWRGREERQRKFIPSHT